MKLKSWVGHRLRELHLYYIWLTQLKHKKTILLFPSNNKSVGSANLRVYEVAQRLTSFGWNALVVPDQLELKQRLRVAKIVRPDVVFFQKSRHPYNKYEYYKQYKVVFDIDDADYLEKHHELAIKDFCTHSDLVIAGSELVKNWCAQFSDNAHVVWTGTPVNIKPSHYVQQASRKPIIAWACSTSLDYPAEMNFVIAILNKLSQKTSFEFWLYGVSDFQAAEEKFGFLRENGVELKLMPYMKYDEFIDTLGEVAIGLNPLLPEESAFSQGKSFGKVLAYLIAGCVVVASDAADHKTFFKQNINGVLVDNEDEWVETIVNLLSDSQLRERISTQAYNDYLEHLTTDVSASKVNDLLNTIV